MHAPRRSAARLAALLVVSLLALGCWWLLAGEVGAPEVARQGSGAEAPGAREGVQLDAPELQPVAQGEAGPAKGARQQGAQAPRPSAVQSKRKRGEKLPLTSGGRVDFQALGLTGKERGAELLRTEEPAQPTPVRYAFEVGETWEVDTYYREMQAGEGDTWSAPVRWRYEVEREDRFRGRAVRVVVVKMLDAQGRVDGRFPASTFYVDKQDHRLVGADLYEVRGGKGKYTTVAYEPGKGPVQARGSIVPFDLPPNGVEGNLRVGAGLPHLEPEAEGARGRFPRPGELVGAGAESIALRYELPGGGSVRQRWAPGDMRWPVESVGPHRRSYRVKGK